MIREIKYRAWTVKGMTRPFTLEYLQELPHPDPLGNSDQMDIRNYPIGECIPMEFTGLHDKNGKEIFESDILLVESIAEIIAPEPDDAEQYEPFESVENYYIILHCDDNILGGWWTEGVCHEHLKGKHNDSWEWDDGDDVTSYPEASRLQQLEVVGNIYDNPELVEYRNAA
jgi:uncharacterized phage protein (TIGR01671 family)